jgi:large subunit ribosomal protein L6
MSRIGKKPIIIPENITVEKKDRRILIKGDKGDFFHLMPEEINIEIKNNEIVLSLKKETKKSKALWGLTRALLYNYIEGLTKGFQKNLELVGVGYRAALEGNQLVLDVGYSNKVKKDIPQDLTVTIEKNVVTISGIDKQRVGEFAAKIRKIRPPEPYKGKGIKYSDEIIRRKEGKKAVTSGGAGA